MRSDRLPKQTHDSLYFCTKRKQLILKAAQTYLIQNPNLCHQNLPQFSAFENALCQVDPPYLPCKQGHGTAMEPLASTRPTQGRQPQVAFRQEMEGKVSRQLRAAFPEADESVPGRWWAGWAPLGPKKWRDGLADVQSAGRAMFR